MFDMFLSKNICKYVVGIWYKMPKLQGIVRFQPEMKSEIYQFFDRQMYADVLYCWRMVFGKKLYRDYFIFYNDSGSY